MATPKGLQGVSTPKNPLVSTPNRPTASPRSTVGTLANKSLAYKSPAIKTPASFHGHSHRMSISSHPTSTPLAAPAIHDELLNLNSPAAALIASIGNATLTPIATGQDGLGIATGLPQQAMGDAALLARAPEIEKLDRLEQVLRLLKTKTGGRGVTREGVERVAQIQGFTILWDEENLTVAGNSVDLEITFDKLQRDVVRDVQLRLNTSGSEEPQLQQEASELLSQHLGVSTELSSSTETWKSLREFSLDLEYLSQLDYAEGSTNCFELIGSLYSTFRKIWDEERKRMRDRTGFNHVCQGNIGEPSLDRNGQLGVTSRYWVNRQTYQSSLQATQIENSWVARFSCKKGAPGIRAERKWLENEVLKTAVTTEDVFEEVQIERPLWIDEDSNSERQHDDDVMMLDANGNGNSTSLDLIFTCDLSQAIMIPLNAVNEMNGIQLMIAVDQRKGIIYQQALLNESTSSSGSTPNHEWKPDIRWSRQVSSFTREGLPVASTHSYSLFTKGVPWSYPVSDLQFSHPKHYADAVPVLRQYALLWNILSSSLARNTSIDSGSAKPTSENSRTMPASKTKVTRRNNKQLVQSTLEDLLNPKLAENQVVPINLSLDLLTNPSQAKIEVIVPLPVSLGENRESSFLHVAIDVCRNGLVQIPLLSGLGQVDEDKMKRKATKVLGLSEDLSVLVEWLLGEAKTTGRDAAL